jgi:ATP-dependent DNA helicase RecQ
VPSLGENIVIRQMPGPERKPASTLLYDLLHRHWGYSEFRPKQEAIVTAILAGRDAAVIMPTGGGKSLCYQLPAVAMGKTCVVISPLIALMQDQAASLGEMGIEAAFFNSSLSASEQHEVRRRAALGEFRLLYLSPERAVRPDVLEWLGRIPLCFFAIDEAHCISEWGHEFRPDYRELRVLRERFPDIPIAAFTASATRQVRHDILAQLGLRDPAKFVMSFHRPNLRYVVRECAAGEQAHRLRSALEWYEEGNVIVYAPTIREVEATASQLSKSGIPAVPYHGQMDAKLRAANQEIWMSGERRVLVGTIAFGLGINKPDVRAVIHLSLPKSLEQYYQEAGRAGRDGLEADCVLLWQKRDAGLLAHFIQQVQDPAERDRSWQRYRVIRRFVEGSACRHRTICLHFGETPKWETCGACDRCGVELEWMAEAASPAKSPAAATTRAEVRRKLAREAAEPDPVDTNLRDALKQWRRAQAQAHGVPAFVILHDSSIDELARVKPRSMEALLGITGIGERKAARYGKGILRVLGGT